jgi:hypothetical protein
MALCIVALPATSDAGVTQEAFQARSTRDLVELCSATPDDPMSTAALNFCHGFGVGVNRVWQEVEMNHKTHLYCLPNPLPTRNESLAGFVQWAKTNPDQLAQPPQDGFLAFLSSQYPCTRKRQ